MADSKPAIYMGRIEGDDDWRLFRATDSRLVRNALLEGVHPPKTEVRRPTIEEAMDFALDGVTISDLLPKPPPADPKSPPLELQQPDADKGEDQREDLNDAPRLAPGEEIDPETGEVVDSATGNPLFDR